MHDPTPSPPTPGVAGPRLRVLWLIAVAVATFLGPWQVGTTVLVVHLVWCWRAGATPADLLRSARRLGTFMVFILLTMLFFPANTDVGDGVGVGPLTVYPGGLVDGLVLSVRLCAVVFASLAVRAGAGADAFARGLRSLGLPTLLALSLDAVFGLLADTPRRGGGRGRGRGRGGGGGGGRGRGRGGGGGRGRGRGGGGGRGRHRDDPGPHRSAPMDDESRLEQLRRYFKAVRGQDPDTFARPLARSMDRATERLSAEHPDLPPEVIHDAAVISGVAAVMVGLRWFKTLPGLPFAPGHKNAVLLPLYVVASEMTHSRLGATFAGLTMGTIGFLSGDGRYGIFEVFKHAAPGLLADLLHPVFRRIPLPRVPVYTVLGVILAVGRLGAELSVALALGVPGTFYALIGGVSITHVIAGALSGFVSAALLGAIDRVTELRSDTLRRGMPHPEDDDPSPSRYGGGPADPPAVPTVLESDSTEHS